MSLTFEEIKEKLELLDEITLLELLNISSRDLVLRFDDVIEDNLDKIERELE
jgi:hypothetical protein